MSQIHNNKFYISPNHQEDFITTGTDANSYIYNYIFGRQIYNIIPQMEISSEDIVVDVGAHIGIFSRYAGEREAKKVISFEMMPNNFACLRLNVRPEDDVFNCVIFDKNYMRFKLQDDISVNGFTLNHFFEGGLFERVDFLKIDVEGKESILCQAISKDVYDVIDKISLKIYDIREETKPIIINFMKEKGFSNHFNVTIDKEPFQFLYFWK